MDQICDGRDIEPDREERGPPRKSSKRGRSQIDPEHTAFAFTRFGDDIQDVFLRIARGTLLSDWSIWGVTYIVVGYEACPATARHHLQGYLQTEQPIQVSTIRDKLPGYSIDVAKSTLKNNFDYCTGNHTGKEPYKKYESSDEGPINVGTFTESGVSRHIDGYRHTKPSKQGARRDLEEVYNAISEGNSWDDIERDFAAHTIMYRKALTDLYERHTQIRIQKQLKTEFTNVNLREWQQECLQNLDTQNKRQISVWWSHTGGEGKSWMAKYLMVSKNYLMIEGGAAKKADLVHALGVQLTSASCGSAQGVVFDVTRSIEIDGQTTVNAWRSICQIAEAIKNGIIFSAKYNSRMVLIPEQARRVIIFANNVPAIHERQQLLSMDRWDVHEIINF